MATVTSTRAPSLAGSLLTLARPRLWLRNLLVTAVPIAAGTLLHRDVLIPTAQAFVGFSLAASATYCLNDVLDAAADARHERKRRRPVASGRVSRAQALSLAVVLVVAALAVSWPGSLRWAVLAYLVVTTAYTVVLKHQPVIELALVSGGFLLRAIAGGAATGTPISNWFLIVTAFGSLYMVTGKRLSELVTLGAGAGTRSSLLGYTQSYLRMMLATSAAVAVMAYCLWAFGLAKATTQSSYAALSVIPLVLIIMRYALDADAGRAEEPEQIVLRDHVLQGLGLIWLVTFWLAAMA